MDSPIAIVNLLELFRDRANPHWDIVTSRIQNGLGLPDCTTRHGLKQVMRQFDRIYDMLEETYVMARNHDSAQLMAGVVVIWTKMCADMVIRDKLLGRELLDRVVALLNSQLTRHIALEMLLALTHLCASSHTAILEQVARHNGVLVQLLGDSEDDPTVAELVVVIMSHTIPATSSSLHEHSQDRAEAYSVYSVLQSTVALLRTPRSRSPSLLTHALSLLAIPAQYFPEQCKGVESLPSLFVAFLRSKDVVPRAVAMDALINLSRAECERDQYSVDLRRVRDILSGTQELPEGMEAEAGWINRSYAYRLYSSTVEYFTVLSQLAIDRDLREHGRRLAEIVQHSPCAVEGEWAALEDDEEVAPSARMPLHLWSDALAECARVLRLTGAPADRDAADILDMKFLLMRNRLLEAVSLGQRIITDNRGLAYAYYVVSLSGDLEKGVRAAKDGLKCANATPFLCNQMLWRAVDLGVGRGLSILTSCIGGDSRTRAEGIAILSSALEDADTFIAETPADAPLLLTVHGWRIVLKLLLDGPDFSSNLMEFRGTFRQMRRTADLMKVMGYSINKTALYLTWSYISENYQRAAGEWGELIRSYDQVDPNVGCPATYFDTATHAYHYGSESPGATHAKRRTSHRCDRCRSPSQPLKLCKGCLTARYCDSVCQRAHWTVHRETCRGRI